MSYSAQQAVLNGFATQTSATTAIPIDAYKQLFEENRHKIYSLAFWMTGGRSRPSRRSGDVQTSRPDGIRLRHSAMVFDAGSSVAGSASSRSSEIARRRSRV